MVRVGIIDSGYTKRGRLNLASYKDFTDAATLSPTDILGHGSAVANTIASRNLSIECHIARVFEDSPLCSALRVAQALDWLVNAEVQIINMSFGLKEDREILAASCTRAINLGMFLIAAAPARGPTVYPSGYDGVIRATGDARCGPVEISNLNSEQADFGGYPGNLAVQPAGASVGCASVSAAFTREVIASPTLDRDSLVRLLRNRATYQGNEHHSSSRSSSHE